MDLDLTTPPTPEEIKYGADYRASHFNKREILAGESEAQLQIAVVGWIRTYYPDVIIQSSFLQGNVNNVGMSIKANQMGYTAGFPDLILLCPKGGFHGLFMELKNGSKGKVSENQRQIMDELIKQGYAGGVVKTFEAAKLMVTNYMESK